MDLLEQYLKEEWHFNYLGINKTKLGPYSILSPSPNITKKSF